MRPKFILWIVFSVLSSTWYALDPAAHPLGDHGALAQQVGIGQGVHQAPAEAPMRTAML